VNQPESDRVKLIREKLTAAFSPERLEIIDDSHKHAGHASARGGGHFTVRIVSPDFHGKNLVERHRMVFAALAEEMQSNAIHALSIDAAAPDEIH
jgi:BolA protein